MNCKGHLDRDALNSNAMRKNLRWTKCIALMTSRDILQLPSRFARSREGTKLRRAQCHLRSLLESPVDFLWNVGFHGCHAKDGTRVQRYIPGRLSSSGKLVEPISDNDDTWLTLVVICPDRTKGAIQGESSDWRLRFRRRTRAECLGEVAGMDAGPGDPQRSFHRLENRLLHFG